MAGLFLATSVIMGGRSIAAGEPAPSAVSPDQAGEPRIHFDRTVYDFGTTSKVEHVTGVFHIQNTGTGELKIEQPASSCSCTVAAVKPQVVAPGEQAELKFTLSLPKTRATIQKDITVLCNDPRSRTNILAIKAEYVPLFDLTMQNWYLINLHKGNVTNLTARVTRTDGKPFAITDIRPSQTNSLAWLRAKAEPDPSSTTNTSETITVTITAGDGPKYLSDVLNVFIDHSPQPSFTLPVSARVSGDVELSREMVYWTVVDPAKLVASQVLTARSAIIPKFEIKKASSSLSEVTVQTVPKDDHTVDLVAKLATIPGHTTNGVLHLETNVSSQPAVDLPIIIVVFKPAPPPPAPARK